MSFTRFSLSLWPEQQCSCCCWFQLVRRLEVAANWKVTLLQSQPPELLVRPVDGCDILLDMTSHNGLLASAVIKEKQRQQNLPCKSSPNKLTSRAAANQICKLASGSALAPFARLSFELIMRPLASKSASKARLAPTFRCQI